MIHLTSYSYYNFSHKTECRLGGQGTSEPSSPLLCTCGVHVPGWRAERDINGRCLSQFLRAQAPSTPHSTHHQMEYLVTSIHRNLNRDLHSVSTMPLPSPSLLVTRYIIRGTKYHHLPPSSPCPVSSPSVRRPAASTRHQACCDLRTSQLGSSGGAAARGEQ